MQAQMQIAHLSAEIEAHYRQHRKELEQEGKSLQLEYGELSMRLPSTPALIPVKGWSWGKIAKEVKKAWGPRYFLKPRMPSINKIKLKSELSAMQLAKVGLMVDATESFSIQLNRLPVGDQPRSEAA